MYTLQEKMLKQNKENIENCNLTKNNQEYKFEKLGGFMSLITARRFIKTLMMKLEKFRYRFLKKKHFDFIKDKSSVFIDSNTEK